MPKFEKYLTKLERNGYNPVICEAVRSAYETCLEAYAGYSHMEMSLPGKRELTISVGPGVDKDQSTLRYRMLPICSVANYVKGTILAMMPNAVTLGDGRGTIAKDYNMISDRLRIGDHVALITTGNYTNEPVQVDITIDDGHVTDQYEGYQDTVVFGSTKEVRTPEVLNEKTTELVGRLQMFLNGN